MMRRKVDDERQARAYLAAVARSGESIGAWSRARGVDGRSLRAWQMNLSRRGRGGHREAGAAKRAAKPRARSSTLVELVPVMPRAESARYVITVGHASVEVSSDFDAATLGRLLGVLRAC
jgi:hypothetical protein